MSASLQLRALTQGRHDQVDAAFGALGSGSAGGLSDPGSYRAFLHAHALALPAAEGVMAGADLPAWRPRARLLAADLAALGAAMPEPLPFAPPAGDGAAGDGAAWGIFYVVEGSRLGGAMLARQVGDGLPRAYLADAHRSGEWRAQRAAIDAAGAAGGERWLARAAAGAAACFDLYARAAHG